MMNQKRPSSPISRPGHTSDGRKKRKQKSSSEDSDEIDSDTSTKSNVKTSEKQVKSSNNNDRNFFLKNNSKDIIDLSSPPTPQSPTQSFTPLSITDENPISGYLENIERQKIQKEKERKEKLEIINKQLERKDIIDSLIEIDNIILSTLKNRKNTFDYFDNRSGKVNTLEEENVLVNILKRSKLHREECLLSLNQSIELVTEDNIQSSLSNRLNSHLTRSETQGVSTISEELQPQNGQNSENDLSMDAQLARSLDSELIQLVLNDSLRIANNTGHATEFHPDSGRQVSSSSAEIPSSSIYDELLARSFSVFSHDDMDDIIPVAGPSNSSDKDKDNDIPENSDSIGNGNNELVDRYPISKELLDTKLEDLYHYTPRQNGDEHPDFPPPIIYQRLNQLLSVNHDSENGFKRKKTLKLPKPFSQIINKVEKEIWIDLSNGFNAPLEKLPIDINGKLNLNYLEFINNQIYKINDNSKINENVKKNLVRWYWIWYNLFLELKSKSPNIEIIKRLLKIEQNKYNRLTKNDKAGNCILTSYIDVDDDKPRDS